MASFLFKIDGEWRELKPGESLMFDFVTKSVRVVGTPCG